MTITQQFLTGITELDRRFQTLDEENRKGAEQYEASRRQAEADYAKEQARINAAYDDTRDRINGVYDDALRQIRRERDEIDRNHAQAQKRINEDYEGKVREYNRQLLGTLSSINSIEKQTEENVRADQDMLMKIENRIKRWSETAQGSGSRPDFNKLISLLKTVSKPAPIGFIAFGVMSIALGALAFGRNGAIPLWIGLGVLGVLLFIIFIYKTVKKSAARDDLSNSIADAKAYLSTIIEESTAAAKRERDAADKTCNAAKADAEREKTAALRRDEERQKSEIAAFEKRRDTLMPQKDAEKKAAEQRNSQEKAAAEQKNEAQRKSRLEKLEQQEAVRIAAHDKAYAGLLNDLEQEAGKVKTAFDSLNMSNGWPRNPSQAKSFPTEIMFGVLEVPSPHLPVSETTGRWQTATEFLSEKRGVELLDIEPLEL